MEHYKNLSLEDLDGEEWRVVEGWNYMYSVSNLGRLKRRKRVVCNGKYNDKSSIQIRNEKILHQHRDAGGYVRAKFCINSNTTTVKVHRIVASAFIENPEKKPQVNHISGVRDDNRVENLEWVTRCENIQHSFKFLNRQVLKGENNSCSKLNNIKVRIIKRLNGDMPYTEIARIFKVDPALIRRICMGINWAHIK